MRSRTVSEGIYRGTAYNAAMMKSIDLKSALVLLTSLIYVSAFQTMVTTHTYITDRGITCVLCPSGYYFHSDCQIPGTIAVCKPCPTGAFSMNYSRAVYCEPCRDHCESDVLVTVQKCTPTTDMVCDCPPGTIRENADKRHAKCIPFTGCRPGSGVLQQGKSDREPVCEECRPGITFSPELSSTEPCYPCTSCPNNDYFRECNTTHNSICNIPRTWQEDAALHSLIVNGVFIVIILLIVTVIAVAWRRGWIRQPDRNRPGDIEEREMLTRNSSDSGLDRGSQDLPDARDDMVSRSMVPWESIFRFLSTSVIPHWKTVVRFLFQDTNEVGDRVINRIEHDHETTPERIYQCLLSWQQQENPESTEKILRALTEQHMTALVEELHTKYPSAFPVLPGTT